MKMSDRALSFTMRAIATKKNKAQNERIAILHSIIVGDILKRYSCDDVVVTAGYLSNIVEDSDRKYSLQDMTHLFHGNVSSLLITNDRINLPINDANQRRQIVRICKDLPPANRLVIAANLIANLEIERIKLQKGEYNEKIKDEKDYYESMLEVLEDDFIHPIFDHLYNCIRLVFYNSFSSPDNHQQMKPISSKFNKNKLVALKNLLESPKPFIIEFTSDSSEKNSLKSAFEDFAQPEGFKIKVVSEKSPRKFEKEYLPDSSVDLIKRNLLVASEIEAGVLSEISDGKNIMIIEQGVFERLIWLQRLLSSEVISNEAYNDYINLSNISEFVNYVAMDYSNSKVKFNHKTDFNDNSNTALKNCLAILNGQPLLEEDEMALGILGDLLPLMKNEQIQYLKLYLEKVKRVAA